MPFPHDRQTGDHSPMSSGQWTGMVHESLHQAPKKTERYHTFEILNLVHNHLQVSTIESNVADLHDERAAPEGDWRRALASPSQKQFRLPRNSPWRSDVDYTVPSPRAMESRPEFDDIPTKSHQSEHESRVEYAESRSISLTGETTEDGIPACRTEADEALEMPSVKRLMSRFKRGDSEPTESSVTRVRKHLINCTNR